MVHGNAASPTATLITDDNHLPPASTNYKLRLVNGLTGAAQPLSMDVNFIAGRDQHPAGLGLGLYRAPGDAPDADPDQRHLAEQPDADLRDGAYVAGQRRLYPVHDRRRRHAHRRLRRDR